MSAHSCRGSAKDATCPNLIGGNVITKRTVACTNLLLALVVAFAPSLATIAHAQDQAPKVIEMTAKKYEFNPLPLHIKKGQKIQLKITATDHDHGFKISPYPEGADRKGTPGIVFASEQSQDCWKVKKGETVIVEFTAPTAGTYTFKCCVDCGWGHRRMKGELIVDE